VNIRDGVGSVGGAWFPENVRIKLDNGSQALFWMDRWLDEVPLQVWFPHLFDLSENKWLTVAQMFDLGWDEGGEAWKWRRRLWAWEEELLVECRLILLTVVLQVSGNDVWMWLRDPSVGYAVRGAYRILTSGTLISHDAPLVSADLLWRKNIPLKVSVFAWRLFRNRLPTKANLFCRGVIHNEA